MHSTPISFHLSRITYVFLGIVAGVFIGTTIKFALGWNAPLSTPPQQDEIFVPVNTGPTTQTKNAGINLNNASGNGNLYAGGIVSAPTLCIGIDCRTVWPGGGAVGDNLGNQTANATSGLNMSNTTIFNVRNPLSPQDAATKDYVDARTSNYGPLKFLKGMGCAACSVSAGGYGTALLGSGATVCKVKNQDGLIVNPGVEKTYQCRLVTVDSAFAFWTY